MSVSKISVDLRQRTFTIEVPDDRVEVILEKIEKIFKNEPVGDLQVDFPVDDGSGDSANGMTVDSQKNDDQKTGSEVGGRKRSRVTAKPKAWNTLELPLTAEQRQELRDFFNEMSPSTQNDSVAVVAVKLKKLLNKSSFSGEEIHSALKIVSIPTPRNLVAVFGNIRNAGIGNYVENKLVVNSLMEDHVAFHMDANRKKSGNK